MPSGFISESHSRFLMLESPCNNCDVCSINKIRSKCAFTSFISFTASRLQCHCHREWSSKWSLQHGSKPLFHRAAFQMCSSFEFQAILDLSNKVKQGWVLDFKQSNPCQSFAMNTQSHWFWHLRKLIWSSRKNETCHFVTQLLHWDFFRRHPCGSLNHIFRPQSLLEKQYNSPVSPSAKTILAVPDV